MAVIKLRLIKHTEPDKTDLAVIKAIKKRMRRFLNEKFVVTIEHIIASFLTPGLKTNFISAFPDQTLVKDAKEYLRSLVNETQKTSESPENQEPPQKKSKKNDILSEFYSSTKAKVTVKLNEYEQYLVKPVSEQECEQSPLQYWKDTSDQFPKLSKIAMEYLSIPATSVKSEQNFSTAGQLMRDRRTNLSSETIDAILFDRSNISYALQ